MNNQKHVSGVAGSVCTDSHHQCLTTPPSSVLVPIYSTTESHKRLCLFVCMPLTLLECASLRLSPCICVCVWISPLQLVCMTELGAY